MSQKEIPAQVEITCDICGKIEQCDNPNTSKKFSTKAELIFRRLYVPDGDQSWDVCDVCTTRVTIALENLKNHLKKLTPQ